jgi:hypothetical protein
VIGWPALGDTAVKMRVVETEPQSPFEALWRQFPQLKNSVCVGRMSWSGGVLRTFRTLDGKYVQIKSTEKGNELEPVPSEEIEIYEDVWKHLGPRALGDQSNPQPHGIIFASDEFFQLTEDQLLED